MNTRRYVDGATSILAMTRSLKRVMKVSLFKLSVEPPLFEERPKDLTWPPFDAFSILKTLGIVIAFSLMAGFVLPAVVAAFSDVFFSIKVADLPDGGGYKYSFQPFYGHIISYFWPIMYFCLGISVFIIYPPGQAPTLVLKASLLSIMSTAAAIYIVDMAPLWHRVFIVTTPAQGRTVYAYSNWRISRLSFVVHQFNFLIFSVLIATVWVQWLSFATERYKGLTSEIIGEINVGAIARLSMTMFHWQTACGIISAAFILYTAIFWNQIIINHDLRFGYEAVIAHFIWLITLTIITIPLALTWFFWRITKLALVLNLMKISADAQSSQISLVQEIEPIGIWNAAISGFGVLASFALPIVQALLHK